MLPARASRNTEMPRAALVMCVASLAFGSLRRVGADCPHAADNRGLIPGDAPGNAGRASVAPPASLGADESVPVRVAIYGDSRDDRRIHRVVVDATAHAKPDIVLFTGDALGCRPLGHMPDYGAWTYAIPFWWQYHRYYPAAGLSSIIPFPALVHESIGS